MTDFNSTEGSRISDEGTHSQATQSDLAQGQEAASGATPAPVATTPTTATPSFNLTDLSRLIDEAERAALQERLGAPSDVGIGGACGPQGCGPGWSVRSGPDMTRGRYN